MNRPSLLITLLVLVVASCGSLGESEPVTSGETATATSQEQSATLPPMTIVTRTPVDPNQLPTIVEGEPEKLEVPATYIVEEGDSLYSIAARFQVDLAEIVALNGLADPNDISVGQELQMPVPEGG